MRSYRTTEDIPALVTKLQEMLSELSKRDDADFRWLCDNASVLDRTITILEDLQNV